MPTRGARIAATRRRRTDQLADDELLVLQDHHPLDHVLELADVAGPLVGLKELLELLRRDAPRPVVPARVAVDEELREVRDLVAPLAQRRHGDLDDLEPVVEILAELAPQHHLLEIAVGRRDHPDVDVDVLVAAELGELRVLEDVEQLGLQRRFHLADLVEEDGAGVGLFELADARRGGAGEGALLVAEQLAFEQLTRQRGAVHLDERPVLARRTLVDGARHELLADAALAADEHGDVAVRHLLDHPGDRLHLGAVAPEQERPVLVVAQLPPQLGDLRHQLGLLDLLLDSDVELDFSQPFGVVGLDHVVGGAEAERLDDRRRLLAARQHDHLQVGLGRLQRLQRLDPVHAGHHHVEQHDVRGVALLDRREHLVAARIGPRFVAAQRQKRAQVARKRGIVVDDGDKGLLQHSTPHGQRDDGDGAAAGRRPDSSTVALDDPAGNRQRESEAAAFFIERNRFGLV